MREVAIVRTADGDEIYFGETIGDCKRYCIENNVTGSNGEYIAIGTFDENTRYFEIEDYADCTTWSC